MVEAEWGAGKEKGTSTMNGVIKGLEDIFRRPSPPVFGRAVTAPEGDDRRPGPGSNEQRAK